MTIYSSSNVYGRSPSRTAHDSRVGESKPSYASRLWAAAKRAGAAALRAFETREGRLDRLTRANADYTRRAQAFDLSPPGPTAREVAGDRRANLLTSYQKLVKDAGLLPGERSQDLRLRRLRMGYERQTGARVAVYDQEYQRRQTGMTLSRPVRFSDGRTGELRTDFRASSDQLRVSETALLPAEDGHGFAEYPMPSTFDEQVLGGRLAEPEDVAQLERLLGSTDMRWADPQVVPA